MITIYFGKSAAGKDTFLRHAVECGMAPIISYTTRPMRVGEKDGVDYHFVSREQFDELEKSGFFLEVREYNTINNNNVPDVWKYAAPIVEPTKECATVLDIKGICSFIDQYGICNVHPVYVFADDNVREERARLRGSFNEAEWARRLKADNEDFSDEKLQELISLCGGSISAINNNHERPMFSTLTIKDFHGR